MAGLLGVLVKFVDHRWVDKFVEGKLFMRPLREFVTLFEGDEVRRDEYEDVETIMQASGFKLNVKHEGAGLPVGSYGRVKYIDEASCNGRMGSF